jgi:pantothenate kinase-related protein Tda10
MGWGRGRQPFDKLRTGWQIAAGSWQRDNAHCAFINYHLAFYSNVSNSVIYELPMINAN